MSDVNLSAIIGAFNVQSVTSASTITPTFYNDVVDVTAQAADFLIANPTGVVVDKHPILITIKDNGTSRAITFDTQYNVIGLTLPGSTVPSKMLYIGIVYRSAATKWDVVSVQQEV